MGPIDEEELLKASRYQFDVWCAGYNWLQSNRQSALDVRDYIENTVWPFYQKEYDLDPEQMSRMKVILVTHSMGGLVARALTQLHGYERVLGVVHGVQPATGSSTIYHHMRCGYEGIAQVVLGRNAGEVTAVVANSAGALELAPSAEYREGRPGCFCATRKARYSRILMESLGLIRRTRILMKRYTRALRGMDWCLNKMHNI